MKSLYQNIQTRRALSPVAAVTDDTAYVSEIIDMQGYESMMFVLLIGEIADVDATFVVLLEEGDDSGLSDAADVADSDMVGSEALATFLFSDDDKTEKLEYHGQKRYVRLTVTPAANGGDLFLAAVALMGNPRHAPVSHTPA